YFIGCLIGCVWVHFKLLLIQGQRFTVRHLEVGN
ncbi:MAG: hypothetical protein ACI8P3_003484, partial [Saprospiraceae bacterium]